ncbi:hypothetical protein V8G54_008493 [Vigna mungo]|uniref:E3 ubiquitin-protein ligase APD1-4 middle domain-containing protein n=1 Tax=Vigna mungo TaxID=3915 RepID=A0AAQ3P5B5_VIGMU
MVEEDDRYQIGVLNMNAKNIILTMEVNVSAKVYDTTKAKKMCSTENGPCRLSFFFPDTHYVILTAANNGNGVTYVEISLVARVVVYVLILGTMIKVSVLKPLELLRLLFYLILKILGVYDDAEQHSQVTIDVTYRTSNVVATQTETEPLMRVEENRMSYGTNAKRNSFFVPCGHCATCYMKLT